MTPARRALAYSFAAQYGSMIAQIATTIVLSRLLLPEEVGVFSISASLLLLGHVLRDFGTGEYVVQEKELTQDRIRAAFGVTLFIGWMFALLIGLIAPWAADFYENEGVEEALSLLAINFALLPFGTITSAYLRRKLNFQPIMFARLASAVAGAVVTISCAFAGFSYLSMAWGGIANAIATILIMLYYRPAELPKLPGFKETRRVLSFGVQISIINLLQEFSVAVPELVLGKTFGMHGVGIFSRARGTSRLFSQLVMNGIWPVTQPLFAEISRSDGDLRATYVKGMNYLTVLAWPFFGWLALLAEDVTRVLFGETWLEIVPVVVILCVSVGLGYFAALANSLFTATGHVNKLLRVSLVTNSLHIVTTATAAFISLQAVAWASLITGIARLLLFHKPLHSVCGIIVSDYLKSTRESGLVTVATLLPIYLFMLSTSTANIHPFVNLMFTALLGVAFWTTGIFLFKHPIRVEAEKVFHAVSVIASSFINRSER